jgi:hypothetical protein
MYKLEESNNKQWMDVVYSETFLKVEWVLSKLEAHMSLNRPIIGPYSPDHIDPAVFKYTKLDLQISPPHE